MVAKPEGKGTREGAPEGEKAGTLPGLPVAAARPARAAWLPAIVAVVLAPLTSYAVAQYLLLPHLRQSLNAVSAAGPAPASPPAGPARDAKGGKGGAEPADTYDFTNVVVNLAGTMGTRYLKTSFVITSAGGANVRAAFEGQKAKMTDLTLGVLSSLTLADLEEPGAKNLLREKLVATYNQAFGQHTVDQVYFSDFVVQ